jgi:hypothetical protein
VFDGIELYRCQELDLSGGVDRFPTMFGEDVLVRTVRNYNKK